MVHVLKRFIDGIGVKNVIEINLIKATTAYIKRRGAVALKRLNQEIGKNQSKNVYSYERRRTTK